MLNSKRFVPVLFEREDISLLLIQFTIPILDIRGETDVRVLGRVPRPVQRIRRSFKTRTRYCTLTSI